MAHDFPTVFSYFAIESIKGFLMNLNLNTSYHNEAAGSF